MSLLGAFGFMRMVARLAVVLLIGLWFAAGPRTARADGCHAPERPILGLTFSWDVDYSLNPLDRTPGPEIGSRLFLSQPPCSGDAPFSTSHGFVLTLAAIAPSPITYPQAGVLLSVIAGEVVLSSQDPSTRLDRPPRAFFATP